MMMIMDGSESPTSPEAKLGMKVEDLWDIQEPQLTPTQKLNACFESIPVSSFPLAPPSQGIYMSSPLITLLYSRNINEYSINEFVCVLVMYVA